MDRNLFEYLTKRAGKTLQDVADLWGVPLGGVYRRLSGEYEIKRSEMEAWLLMVGVSNATPVFFPAVFADKQNAAHMEGLGIDGL